MAKTTTAPSSTTTTNESKKHEQQQQPEPQKNGNHRLWQTKNVPVTLVVPFFVFVFQPCDAMK